MLLLLAGTAAKARVGPAEGLQKKGTGGPSRPLLFALQVDGAPQAAPSIALQALQAGGAGDIECGGSQVSNWSGSNVAAAGLQDLSVLTLGKK